MTSEGWRVLRVRRPRCWLSEEAEEAIRRASREGHPDEAGGVLIGVYVRRRRPWIVKAVTVPSERRGHAHYVLPPDARPRAVDEARRHDQRLGYIGDWHSHPADVDPSETDVETMRGLASDVQGKKCPHPVLLIARRDGESYKIDARQLKTRSLERMRVIAAGGLTEMANPSRPKR
jgi:proteasome lid subunit RPN8/RPN11